MRKISFMNRIKSIVFVLAFISALAGLAAGQEAKPAPDPTLSTLPAGEKFISTAAGFSISLPKVPAETTPVQKEGETGVEYNWKVREGVFYIQHGQFTNGYIFQPHLYKPFFDGFKNGLLKDSGIKLVSEDEYKSGGCRGMTYIIDYRGLKGWVRVLAFDNRYFTMTAVSFPNIKDADALLLRAMNSASISGGACSQP